VAELGKLWAGRVFGTNTGNLFIEFQRIEPPHVSGALRFMDTVFGLAVYSIEGTFDEALRITGKPTQGARGIELGELTAEATLTPEGNLRGTWTSSLGTGGTFEAFPHDPVPSRAQSRAAPMAPEQLYTKNIALGSIRLFAEDVKQLLTYIRQDFLTGRPVVTFNARGGEVTRYAEDFLRDADSLGRLGYFKVTIQEPEAYGINRLVVVELSAFGSNEVRVQGVQESWVIGKAEAIASLLRGYQSTLITTYKKFGLNLNQAIFLAMLVVMPSINAWINRALFAVSVFILLTAMLWLHARFIPNASIRMGIAKPTFLGRIWPTLLSWLVAVSAALVAALVFYWLTKSAC
jgi:hypothetical protein